MKRIILITLCSVMAACTGEVAQSGPMGPQGDEGAQGERGPMGPAGAPGMGVDDTTVVHAKSSENDGDGLITADAECEGHLVSGGCRWGKYPGNVTAYSTMPLFDENEETIGWRCQGLLNEGVPTEVVEAFAVCAP